MRIVCRAREIVLDAYTTHKGGWHPDGTETSIYEQTFKAHPKYKEFRQYAKTMTSKGLQKYKQSVEGRE